MLLRSNLTGGNGKLNFFVSIKGVCYGKYRYSMEDRGNCDLDCVYFLCLGGYCRKEL